MPTARSPFVGLLFLLLIAPSAAAQANRYTVSLEINGRRVEGFPLRGNAEEILLLSRDGRLWDFSPKEAKNYQKIRDGFSSFTQAEMRAALAGEFGKAYEVSGTGHFLVVHPAGARDQWAARFELLYRAMMQYFTQRGWKPQEPAFPLVAVVFPTQHEFVQYATQSGSPVPTGMLGFYSPLSNRTMLYDVTAGNPDDPRWQTNVETILHEAAHQVAFNCGIHNRFTATPRWLAEGLGTMFEAPGLWDPWRHPQLGDRVNKQQLAAFRQYVASGRRNGAESLANLASSDRRFDLDPQTAYAEAWALSFYLAEAEPRKYVELLQLTAQRPSFVEYPAAERLRDFLQITGNLQLFDSRMLKFFEQLP